MVTDTANAIAMPARPLTGRCQCGAVRYSVKAPPLAFYVCHCTECQKQSASAFGESLQVRADDLELSGTSSTFVRRTDSGRLMECLFCPQCGTRILHRIAGGPPVVNIRGGTLDETGWLRPAAHLWTSSRQPWVAIPGDALTYERQPDDLEPIRARWRAMTGQEPDSVSPPAPSSRDS